MIHFETFTLSNGLHVVVHPDPQSHMAVVNIIYNVGSRDESPNKTGFAHLFEHLMFGGSPNVPSYDTVLENVGAQNNAYTTSDITNYYCALPAVNLETAFWVESDRMLALSFDPEVLALQKKVVTEEFKETTLNAPYGDLWGKICGLAYSVHPYQWPTIGKTIQHIEQFTMEDVKDFFYTFYRPNNAVLVVAGGVTIEEVQRLSKKWFEPIPAGAAYQRNLPQEPAQQSSKTFTTTADVPLNALYKIFHMSGRRSSDYYAVSLLADILGGSKSARLTTKLVEKKQYFNDIHADVAGFFDPGLLVIGGKLNEGVSFETAETAVNEIVAEICQSLVPYQELEKVQNQAEADLAFEAIDLLHRAQELAITSLLGDPTLVNTEADLLRAVTPKAVHQAAQQVLLPTNCSTLYYERKD